MAPHSILDESPINDGLSNGYHHTPFVNGLDSHNHTNDGSPEPIAIVGIGCRLPGGSDSAAKLWDLLAAGLSGQRNIPTERFNMDGFYHPNVDRPGSINTAGGYFIEDDVRGFENSFFGINNLEAMFMDPQQRKLLEVVFECLENAGVSLDAASGSNVGCYVGNFVTDFITMQLKDPEYVHRYTATGLGTTILANRISHVFNFKGPSFMLDTACSSSLYCLHVACSALLAGECDSAVVAGVNLVQTPDQHLGTMKAGVLSKTSTCHTFDSSADGYGRADGVGALLLKKLSDAIRDGDAIRSVIRGTAINSNGKTNGITLPSADGQEAVIRKAYAQARLDFDKTDYVECHGTGTAVGDPIEVEAVSRVFKKPKGSPLMIGSVKTNLGHSEAASGISSIIKVTLALEKGVIPPTIGVKNINPKIKIDDWNVHIVTENTPWPENGLPHPSGRPFRRAGINSFGYGGANAHAILEAADMHVPAGYRQASDILSSRPTVLLPFSASNPKALTSRVSDLAQLDWSTANIVDLAYTLGAKRSHLSARGYILAGHRTLHSDLKSDNLNTTKQGVPYPKLPLAFVFTGQGAQWPQMGKELIEEFPSFRHSIERLDKVLQLLPHPPTWTLRGAILEAAKTSQINKASHSQPVCTAVQVAVIQLLAKWKIHPTAVLGHSSGEIAAAYAAGYITADQAIIIAYYRGYTVTRSSMVGAMMAAGLGPEAAKAKIAEYGLSSVIRVACVNSPESVTISGDADGIDQLMGELSSQGVFARKLKTDGRAYHSHHMAVIGREYEDYLRLAGIGDERLTNSDVEWISSVTGEKMAGGAGPAYWRANLESPVLFGNVVEALITSGAYHMVEIGPHSALELPIKQTRTHLNISDTKVRYNSAISRGKNSVETILHLVGQIYLHGHDVSFEDVNAIDLPLSKSGAKTRKGNLLVDLPNYRWNHDDTVFNEPRVSVEWRNRKYKRHDILGSQMQGGNGLITTWRNILKPKDVSWVEGHKLDQTIVFPAAGFIAMAIEAIYQVTGTKAEDKATVDLRDVKIMKALPLPQGDNDPGVELFTTMEVDEASKVTSGPAWYKYHICTYLDGHSTSHAGGLIKLTPTASAPMKTDLPIDAKVMEPFALRTWYNRFAKSGLNFQGRFQSLTEIQCHRKRQLMHTYAKTNLAYENPPTNPESDYIVHPVTIDALFQAGIIASTAGVVNELNAKVPVLIDHIRVRPPPAKSAVMNVNAISVPAGFGTIKISGELYDDKGEVFLQVDRCRAVAYQSGSLTQDGGDERQPMLRVVWKPDVAALGPGDEDRLSEFTEKFASSFQIPGSDPLAGGVGAALDLLSHKNPTIRVLNLWGSINEYLVMLLRIATPFKRCSSCVSGAFLGAGKPVGIELVDFDESREPARLADDQKFDVVVLPPSTTTVIPAVKGLLNDGGIILYNEGSHQNRGLQDPDFTTIRSRTADGQSTVLARLQQNDQPQSNGNPVKDITLVEGKSNGAFNEFLASMLSHYSGQPVRRVPLAKLTSEVLGSQSTVVSTVELNDPVLSRMTAEEMSLVKTITDNASNLIWVTGGSLFSGSKPEFGVGFGLSRALMLEQPSLRFFVVDVEGDKIQSQSEAAARNIVKVVRQALEDKKPDFEFVTDSGALHVSRFCPDETMNRVFREKQGSDTVMVPLSEAKPCRLAIEIVGQPDSLLLKSVEAEEAPLPDDFVEVSVKAIGLTSRDLNAINGDVFCKDSTCSTQYSGVVTSVGSKVKTVAAGDSVVVMAPGHFSTLERVPAWTCLKINGDENMDLIASIPFSVSTAIYAVEQARIQAGESVLVNSSNDMASHVAIQLAQKAGAHVHVISAGSQKGISALEHGADVILDFGSGLPADNVEDLCATFGRVVQVGKAGDSTQHLSPQKCVAFSNVDMGLLAGLDTPAAQKIRRRLLENAISLFRKGIPGIEKSLRAFDASQVKEAFRAISSKANHGSVVVSFQDESRPIKLLPLKHSSTFSPAKTYLMIGCLGGLGRSMSKWMVSRGARKFVFLGRTGTDRAPARRLVEDLEFSGAQVTVVRGDVINYGDVEKAVKTIKGPIGGVIQAAMGLDEALFTTMTQEYWDTGLAPKIRGSWNLHNAIKGRDAELEFFLMTSSVSGSVGTATESNYCSANYFLDVFARYRQKQGLPATSVGLGMISEVGYLHENPEIEALLLRKGIQAISEDEMLQIIDIALTTPTTSACGYDQFASGHVLTGLEPLGLKELRAKGFEGTSPVMGDPRASLLAAAIDDADSGGDAGSDNGLPSEVAQAIKAGASVHDAVLGVVTKKFSNLVLVQADKLDVLKSINEIGVDSMLAAEFRSWIFQVFKIDVPFLTLLASSTTLSSLAELVSDNLKTAA
ncbi:hypothetical protein F4779DRAFT_595040 [Xylariaceae sp. FL0662B]|nr:hypothetical protein F4779DRAFT_595040 [Xylariaceae sp. FL0662B]